MQKDRTARKDTPAGDNPGDKSAAGSSSDRMACLLDTHSADKWAGLGKADRNVVLMDIRGTEAGFAVDRFELATTDKEAPQVEEVEHNRQRLAAVSETVV